MSGPDASGFYTATLVGNGTRAFPAGAKMRTVALQAYFTQLNAPTDNVGGTGNVARHAISVLKTVTGDTARRTIVDAAKCASCHEWFEGHGGNRVYETQVCVMCHNTGLATSGRGIADDGAEHLQHQHRIRRPGRGYGSVHPGRPQAADRLGLPASPGQKWR